MSQAGESGLGRLFGRRRRERERAGETLRREDERREAEQRAEETLASIPLWTDSHCHLQYAPDEEEEAAIVGRAVAAGVRRMICVGTDEASSRLAIDLARRRSTAGSRRVDVYATVGLHPHDALEGAEEIARLLGELGGAGREEARLVAVGECGLDYHYDRSPRAVQRTVFAAQVALANEHGLALVVHTREAFDDTLAILDAEGVPARTIFHCFTGGPAEAERCLAVGGYLSFSGIATFTNATEVRESVRLCPPDRLLIETDSPYLTPVPYRGKTNEPCYVPLVGEAVAREKEVEPAAIARLTSSNAVRAFGLAGT